MGGSLISILTLTASSHLYKAIDTGFILVILKLHHMIEIYSSAGFPLALGRLNKNSSHCSGHSHQSRVFIVITLLSEAMH